MPSGMHPNSLANLKPYPPGVSGNPGGRPKGPTVYQGVVRDYEENPRQYREAVEAFKAAVKNGDPAFHRMLLERQDPAKHHAELSLPQLHEGISLLPRPTPRDVIAEPSNQALPESSEEQHLDTTPDREHGGLG